MLRDLCGQPLSAVTDQEVAAEFPVQVDEFRRAAILDDCVRDGALGCDVAGQVEQLEMVEAGLGPEEEEGGEAFEVVVGGGDGQRQAGHPGHQPEDILRVCAIFAK